MIVENYGIKHKTRSIPTLVKTGSIDKRYNSSGVFQSSTARGPYTYQSGSEEITSTSKPRNQRYRSNTCRHYKVSFLYSGGPDSTFRGMEQAPNGINGWYYDYQNHHVQCCTTGLTCIGAARTALGITPVMDGSFMALNAQSYMNSAWQKMQPDLTEVSIPNFLAELDDLKSLYKVWKRSVSLGRNLAGLYLNYKFGWRPTVGDIGAVLLGVKSLHDKLRLFKEAIGNPMRVRTTVLNEATGASGVAGVGTLTWRASQSRKIQAFATYVPQQLAVINSTDEYLRGMMDTLGFELNPSIIWNALPFTFVVDWFFNVGNTLERFKFDALHLPVKLIDSCLQSVEELEVEWEWTRVSSDNWFKNPPRSGGARYKERFFYRLPCHPDLSSLSGLGWRTPNVTQATLLVSLATVLAPKKQAMKGFKSTWSVR